MSDEMEREPEVGQDEEPRVPEVADAAPEAADKDARMWGMLCHLAALAGFVGVPFGHIIGPLLVWQIKRNDHPSIEPHGKAALNFQISMTIYGAVAAVLAIIYIGIPLLLAVVITDVVCIVLASIKTNNGEPYTYPLSIELIK